MIASGVGRDAPRTELIHTAYVRRSEGIGTYFDRILYGVFSNTGLLQGQGGRGEKYAVMCREEGEIWERERPAGEGSGGRARVRKRGRCRTGKWSEIRRVEKR